MSAVVVMARDRREAADAAFNAGVVQYIYPLIEEAIVGVPVGLVLWVEGWRESEIQTVEVARMLHSRLTPDAQELEVPTTMSMLRVPGQASAILAAHRAAKKVSPFVEPIYSIAPPRRSFRQWLLGLLGIESPSRAYRRNR